MIDGKKIVVTGASKGIGFAISKLLSENGAEVAMLSRNEETLKTAIEQIDGKCFPVPCDVSDPIDISSAVSHIKSIFNRTPDIVVNNAGLFKLGLLSEMSSNTFSDVINLNLVSPFLFIRTFLPEMIDLEVGHIITIGSEADHRVFKENGAYSASKYGARALHEVLLLELKGTGVRSTLISPGPTNTSIWDEINPDSRDGFLHRDVMLKPEATADAVLFAIERDEKINIDEIRISSC